MTPEELIAFEDRVAKAMREGIIRTPTHLCGGNEEPLIQIFEKITQEDWIFCSYRNHYHALLYGIPAEEVYAQIVSGRSMTPLYPGRKFFSSALVAGCVPIALGVAAAIKRKGGARGVWCFVGDMAATTGAFSEATRYAAGHELPINFVIEDNGLACDTPTAEVWGEGEPKFLHYAYTRSRPHLGGA